MENFIKNIKAAAEAAAKEKNISDLNNEVREEIKKTLLERVEHTEVINPGEELFELFEKILMGETKTLPLKEIKNILDDVQYVFTSDFWDIPRVIVLEVTSEGSLKVSSYKVGRYYDEEEGEEFFFPLPSFDGAVAIKHNSDIYLVEDLFNGVNKKTQELEKTFEFKRRLEAFFKGL